MTTATPVPLRTRIRIRVLTALLGSIAGWSLYTGIELAIRFGQILQEADSTIEPYGGFVGGVLQAAPFFVIGTIAITGLLIAYALEAVRVTTVSAMGKSTTVSAAS